MENLGGRVLGELFAMAMNARVDQSQRQLHLFATADIGESVAPRTLHLEEWGYNKDIDALRKRCLQLKGPNTWLESI